MVHRLWLMQPSGCDDGSGHNKRNSGQRSPPIASACLSPVWRRWAGSGAMNPVAVGAPENGVGDAAPLSWQRSSLSPPRPRGGESGAAGITQLADLDGRTSLVSARGNGGRRQVPKFLRARHGSNSQLDRVTVSLVQGAVFSRAGAAGPELRSLPQGLSAVRYGVVA